MSSSSPSEPTRFTYIGLFLTTLSILQFELFLTRIFSVTMWYHFAFVAISVALFGMTLGALIVHYFPRSFADEDIREGRVTVSTMLARFRELYSPAPGSPLIDAGDPADGPGADVGAVGAGALHAEDRFGRRK